MFKTLEAALEAAYLHGSYGTEAQAGYADPGYQKDKKARYPLKRNGKYNKKRIKAAWNYIHKVKNRAPYTAEQLAEIEHRIISAWKEHIDPAGPKSAQTKA